MRCKNCNYRLWNLTSRRCPECGTGFAPSEFEFVSNSVRFCCPHCQQDYYGDGPKGHLTPAEFDCVGCKKPIRMDEMVLLPTEGVDEELTEANKLPWLERKRVGLIRAWFSMLWQGMFSPGRMMKSVPVSSSLGQALWFMTFTAMVGALISTILLMVVFVVVRVTWGGGPGSLAFVVALGVLGLLVMPVVTLVGTFLWGAATHGLLRFDGRPKASIRRTYQALCYSCGPCILGAVPFVGPYLFFVVGFWWWMVSAVIAVKEAQGVSGTVAAITVLPPPLLTAAIIVGAYFYLIFSVMSGTFAPGAFNTFSSAQAMSETMTVAQATISYADQNSGQGPDHAIQLVTDTFMTPSSFLARGSATVLAGVPVADTTLLRFSRLTPAQDVIVAQAAVDAMPDDVIAHRLGDYVFTHHGIDLRTADSKLWLVIRSFDPDSIPVKTKKTIQVEFNVTVTTTPAPSSDGTDAVGLVNGTARAIPPGKFAKRLASQNKLRAKYNLPPLPHPSTVTHKKPAVATSSPATP